VPRDHLHLYYHGRCDVCRQREPGHQGLTRLEWIIGMLIFLFLTWAMFVVLVLAHWRGE